MRKFEEIYKKIISESFDSNDTVYENFMDTVDYLYLK